MMAIDKYANIATISVQQSAADTITFQELRTNLGVMSGRLGAQAMLIDQINYYYSVTAPALMTTAADLIQGAVTISNVPPSLGDAADRRILDMNQLQRVDWGVAASGQMLEMPRIHQFFPPLILAERSIYLGVNSSGLASAITLNVRIYYRTVEISNTELIELLEVFRLVG